MSAALALTLCMCMSPQAADDSDVDIGDAAVREAIDGGVAYLLAHQNEDGSWGGVKNATFTSAFGNPATYKCWTVGSTALATLAVLELGKSEEANAAAERGLDFLVANADLKRPAEWDVDNVWGLVYGLDTLSKAVAHPRFRDTERAGELYSAAETMVKALRRYVSPRGGWGYYANPGSAWRPEWATSFTTAVGVLALVEARNSGLTVPDELFDATVRLVQHTRLPNGAYDYGAAAIPRHLRLESINQVKGSLGRIQVCNLALLRAGGELPEGAVQEGIDQFFRYHRFLDAGRNKPIPHEAYYAVAAYFYLFGHYYASSIIETLPPETRAPYEAKLRFHIMKCRQKDGAFWDFWIASTTKNYGTAFSILALSRTLHDEG